MQRAKPRHYRVVLAAVIAASVLPMGASAKSVDDQKAEMDAQIELLRKQVDLMNAQRQAAGSTLTGLPTVVSVVGFDGNMAVKLRSSNGLVSIYRTGDFVRSGMVISNITPKRVMLTIENNKKFIDLPLEFETPPQTATGGMGQGAGGAGMPPGTPSIVPPELLPPLPRVNLNPPMAAPALPGAATRPSGADAGAAQPTGANHGQTPAAALPPSGNLPAQR